ncbi:MarR family transcriptional regulator [Mycobacterium sp. DBP42]|nr:MarR family transcriptional regulator [Mycobacterium sp. DBP42]
MPDTARAGSPPTERVVAIVEFLAAESEPSSVASIATRLELSRSTATAILGALERAGWVQRHADLRYSLGAGLYGVADAVRESMPLSHRFDEALEDLAQRTECDVSLVLVGASTLTFLAVARGHGQVPAGVRAGVHLPLTAPLGATVVAHRDRQAQEAWLSTADRGNQRLLNGLLAHIRQTGVAVFGLGDASPGILLVLTEVAQMLAERPRRGRLQQQVYELLAGLAGNPYTATQLASESELSVSYLTAPIFSDGRAVYELQLGPMEHAVSPAKRAMYVSELQGAAHSLSAPESPS